MTEKADHPAHYGGKENPYEVIKVLEAWFGRREVIIFCKMNAVKYLARAGKKSTESAFDDYEKAKWYANYAAELELKVRDQLIAEIAFGTVATFDANGSET